MLNTQIDDFGIFGSLNKLYLYILSEILALLETYIFEDLSFILSPFSDVLTSDVFY